MKAIFIMSLMGCCLSACSIWSATDSHLKSTPSLKTACGQASWLYANLATPSAHPMTMLPDGRVCSESKPSNNQSGEVG